MIASGVVEGAARYVVGERLDNSGMRWIEERAEAVLLLRCIEVNGDWEAFMSGAKRIAARSFATVRSSRFKPAATDSRSAASIPSVLWNRWPTQPLVELQPPSRSRSLNSVSYSSSTKMISFLCRSRYRPIRPSSSGRSPSAAASPNRGPPASPVQ